MLATIWLTNLKDGLIMKEVAVFEAKTRLSEICDEVARTGESVVVTRRGKGLVQIVPLEVGQPGILGRRKAYMETYGAQEVEDEQDFQPAARPRDEARFRLDE